MANKTKISIQGLDFALRKIQGYSDKVKENLKDAVHEHTEAMADTARSTVPVDTGRLKSEIETDYSSGGFFGRARSKTPYAHIVELGTATHTAQPYMNPAYVQEKPKFIESVKRIVTE